MDTLDGRQAKFVTMPARSLRTRRRPGTRVALGLTFSLTIAASAGCLKVTDDDLDSPGDRTAPSTAEEILTRYVEAMGGEAALRAMAQRTVEARIVLHPVEGCDPEQPGCSEDEQEGSFLLQTTTDGKMYRRMVIETPKGEGAFDKGRGMVSERGFDGEQGWEVQPSTPPILLLEAAAQRVVSREDALLHWYLDYRARGVTPEIQSSREIEVDGKKIELDGLTWKIPDTAMPARTYWFDRATGLLREEVETEPAADGARRTIVYTDYRDVDGVMVPFKIEQIAESGEQKQRIDLLVTRVDHKQIPRPMFDIPELPAADPEPDARLAALEEARADAKGSPDDATAGIAWARAAWAAARFDEAVDAAQATLKADPREPEALYLLGRVHAALGDLKAARNAFDRAARAGVSPEVIAHQLGVLDLRDRKASSAAKKFEAAGEQRLAERWAAAGDGLLDAKWSGNGCTSTIPLIPGFVAPAIEVELDGESLKLLVDTSVSGVVVDQQKALSMLISTDAQSALGPQGPAIGHGTAEQLVLGEVTLRNVPVDMYPPELIADVAMGRDLDGVIGTRAFEQTQLTIDPEAGQLVLVRDAGKCKKQLAERREGPSVPFFMHDDHMVFVRADLNGAEGVFLVNTAMRGAGLAATVGAFARAATASPVVRADEPGAFVQVDDVKVGDLALGTTMGAWGWAEQQAPDSFRVDGMIGIEAVGPRRWTFDFGEQKFYFSEELVKKASATTRQPPGKATGGPADPKGKGEAKGKSK